MAETRVVYKIDFLDQERCFRCAVLYIVSNPEGQAQIETTSYEFSKCAACGEFIRDRIEI